MDGHVHLHPCFEPASLFSVSDMNFRRAADRIQKGSRFLGVVVLADHARAEGFTRLSSLCTSEVESESALLKGGWRIRKTRESNSLIASRSGCRALVVVAGRQVRTREGLEVIAVGTRHAFSDGQPLDILLPHVAEVGAVPVIPWGLGKWLASRGRHVRRILKERTHPSVFIGDNGNRLASWPRPHLFRVAELQGIRNLPGSDSFPLPGEHAFSGSCGAILWGHLDPDEPARSLLDLLRNEHEWERYGEYAPVRRFLRNQLAIRGLLRAA